MRLSLILFGVVMIVSSIDCSPIVKRDANDINPLNEVYVLQGEDDPTLNEDEHGDREKRKIGVIKLGVSNGILNFVFGKLDSFLEAKTKALSVLDESNKAKNAIYGIDPKSSATSAFISDIIGKKIQAGTASIGPLINSATTFVTSKGQGLVGAFTSKLAPLSSLSGGLSGGAGGSSSGSGGGGSGSAISGILNLVSSLSGNSSGGLSGGNGDDDDDDDDDDNESSSEGSSSANAGAGVNIGPWSNGGGVSSTTEDIVEFNRNKVSLDVPPQAFGTGFTTITNISKIFGKLILNSAHRAESILEVFKPIFRGTFAIKGLPSDNIKSKRQHNTNELT